MRYLTSGLLVIILAATIIGCKDNDIGKQRERELKKLEEYIRDNYSGKEPTASGLYFFELQAGVGDSIRINDKVQIFYDLYTLDSSYVAGSGQFEPLQLVVLPPTQLGSSAEEVSELKGLHEALTYMKKGSKARLILPSELAFGQYGTYGVGGFTTLLMEVEVYKVFPFTDPNEEEE